MPSRRTFLQGMFGLALATQASQHMAAQTWARRRLIVDAQVHFWKADTPDRPWPPGRTAQLPEPFTPEKLVPLMDEAGGDRVVIVPPSWEGDRNDYALEAAQKNPRRFGRLGRLPPTPPQAAAPPPPRGADAGPRGGPVRR